MNVYGLWINGKEIRTDRVSVVRVPYDGEKFAEVATAGSAELKMAFTTAARAAQEMKRMTAARRAAILFRARDLLEQRSAEFAKAIASESGKPLKEAKLEASRGVQTLLHSAVEALRLAGEVVPMEAAEAGAGRMAMTVREPLGVIAAITPFNFPLNLSLHKIGPAIAAGNAVIHKPASTTPVSALMLARLMTEAGLPGGALNVVVGPGNVVGDALITSETVRMVTFTGSAEVGLALRARAGMKRVTLELGNNSALIVHHDADLEDCCARAVPGAFAHSGQVCISVQRILVESSIAGRFVEMFTARASELKLGHPLEEETEVSSLISEPEAVRAEQWIAQAAASGARLLRGGKRTGTVIEPAVLDEVDSAQPVWRQEAFAPVACFKRYSTIDEAIALMNDSSYGLQAGIFTRDLNAAFRAAREAEVGGFLINDVPQFRLDHMPYGGVKTSGTGREGPRYAIEEMTEPKLISWRAG